MRSSVVAAILLVSSGCVAQTKRTEVVATAPATLPTVAPVAVAPPTCAELPASRLTSAQAAARKEALADLRDGDGARAHSKLNALLRERPSDVGLFALMVAAKHLANENRKKDADDLAHQKAVRLKSVAEETQGKPPRSDGPRLTLVSSSKAPHADPERWNERHGITGKVADPLDDVAGMIALGQTWTASFPFPDHSIESFERSVLGVIGPGDQRVLFDLRRLGLFSSARVVEGVLIVALDVTEGNAAGESMVAAFDVPSGKPLWRTTEKLGGLPSFVVVGDFVIVGTRSSDDRADLLLIDRRNGEMLQRLPVGIRIDEIQVMGDHLLVFGPSEGEATVKLGEGPLPPSPSASPLSGVTGPSPRAPAAAMDRDRELCVLANALAALDDRDGKRATAALANLDEEEKRGPAAQALESAAAFLAKGEQPTDQTVVDLTGLTPVRLEPLAEKPSVTGASAPGRPRHLKAVPRQAGIDPSDPSGLTLTVPDAYGAFPMQMGHSFPGGSVVRYGNAFVAIFEGGTTTLFDASPLTRPNGAAAPGHGVSIVDEALTKDLLLLALDSQAYAAGAARADSVVAAYDRRTGKLVWQTAPGVCTGRFLLLSNELLAAPATSAQGKSVLNLIRLDSGQTTAFVRLAGEPKQLGFVGQNLAVSETGPLDLQLFAVE